MKFRNLVSPLVFAIALIAAHTSNARAGKPIVGGSVCIASRIGSFDLLVESLKKYHGTTLEESYFDIRCEESDILNMVIRNPLHLRNIGYNLQDYFEDEKDLPEIFSRVIMNKIQERNVLRRIENMLYTVRGHTLLAGTKVETLLVIMYTDYIEYLETYPVPGSADVVAKAKAALVD